MLSPPHSSVYKQFLTDRNHLANVLLQYYMKRYFIGLHAFLQSLYTDNINSLTVLLKRELLLVLTEIITSKILFHKDRLCAHLF